MLIDDKTKVQLFTVLGVIPTFVGFIFWLTMVYMKAEASEKQNEKQDQKIEAQYLLLLDIRDRIIKIETNQNKEK